MNAIDFLKKEHEKAKSKFRELEGASPSQREQLWRRLEPELKLHEQIEMNYLYGPVGDDRKAKGTPLEEWKSEHEEDVSEFKDILTTIEDLDPSSEDFIENVKELKETLLDHIKREETEVWPEIVRIWDQRKLEDAGMKMEDEVKQKLPTA